MAVLLSWGFVSTYYGPHSTSLLSLWSLSRDDGADRGRGEEGEGVFTAGIAYDVCHSVLNSSRGAILRWRCTRIIEIPRLRFWGVSTRGHEQFRPCRP